MKNKKYTMELFSFYNRTELERKLSQRAEKGWMLEKIGSSLWTYHRIEPKKLTFCICCFPKASAFDAEPSEEQQTFYDFCRHTGWTLAASFAQTQVFYNESENPVPIETDPLMEVYAIHRTMKRSVLPPYFLLLALALISTAMFVSRLRRDPIGVLSSPSSLFSGLCWVTVILTAADSIAGHFLWYCKAVRAAEQGMFLESKSRRKVQMVCLAALGVAIAYYFLSILVSGNKLLLITTLLMFGLYLPGLRFLVFWIKAFLQKKKVSAGVNRTITLTSSLFLGFVLIGGITFGVLFGSSHGWFSRADEEVYQYNSAVFTAHHDELPLTVENLLDVRYDGYDRERRTEQSFLLAQAEMGQRPRFDAVYYDEMPRLEYTVTLVKASFLYDLCKQALLTSWEDDWRPDGHKDYILSAEPSSWGAQEAYQLANQEFGLENRFLLCYPDRIVEIRFSWEPTPEQMRIAGEKLGNAAPDAILAKAF